MIKCQRETPGSYIHILGGQPDAKNYLYIFEMKAFEEKEIGRDVTTVSSHTGLYNPVNSTLGDIDPNKVNRSS